MLSGLFSASEVVFFLGNAEPAPTRHRLMRRPSQLLATLLIGNNLVNIAFILRAAMLLRPLWQGGPWGWLTLVVEGVLITLVLLFFGEIFPKLYAQKHPQRLLPLVAPVVTAAYYLFWPLSRLLEKLGNVGGKQADDRSLVLDPKEIRQALDTTGADQPAYPMLRQLLQFQDLEVRQILTPLRDVVAYPDSLTFQEVIQRINDDQYSRVPVYRDSLDNIRGILYVKDLLPYLDRKSFDWPQVLRKAHYVPESMKLPDLMETFRDKGVHMALVVDEYGNLVGLVTMEDLLEEIVGEIRDEFDVVEEEKITETEPDVYTVYGRTTIPELIRALDLAEDYFDPHAEEVETVGGLLTELVGRMPEPGEEIDYKDLHFRVEQVGPTTVELVTVRRAETPSS